MIVNNPILPAGLFDEDIEFFVKDNSAYAMFRFKVIPLNDLPTNILLDLDEVINADEAAKNALQELQIITPEQRREQFIKCRHGAFNNEPDIIDGKIQPGEYWDCGLRGVCKHEGKLCSSVAAENGILTKREIELVRYIAIGLQDKEIADKMGISINTIPPHKKNVFEKIGARSKVDVTVFAINKNIYVKGTSC